MIGDGRVYGEKENLTLSDADFDSPHGAPKPYKGGEKMRAYCPVYGGDNQRSLEVDLTSGRFFCHNASCGCWGYMDWARERYREERGPERDASRHPRSTRRPARVPSPPPPPPPVEPVRDDLDELLARFREALPGSWGARYLELRGAPLDVARAHGIGYAGPKTWPGRGWKGGRLVVPHTTPEGRLVNLYGRAVAKGEVPKALKHDHLKGNKGWFNARVLVRGEGPLYVCEAPLDALALVAAGYERSVAIYGTHGWRWDWIPRDVRRIVLATDADEGGEKAREKIGGEARMRGIEVAYLDAKSYGGEKDAAAARAKGVLRIGEWPEPEPEPPAAPAWDEEWAEERLQDALNYVAEREALRPYARKREEYEARFAASREDGDRQGYETALRAMIRECLSEAGATSS